MTAPREDPPVPRRSATFMLRDLITYLLMKGMVLKGYMDLGSLHRNTVGAREKNEKLLFKILKAGENSEYGMKHGFRDIKNIEDYRRAVPLSTFEDYRPYVDRMINENREDLLTSFPLIGYSQTSGTTGAPKFIPLTQNIADIYKRNTLTTMMAMADRYRRKKEGKPVKPGRGIFICVDFNEKLPNGRSATNVPETTAKQLGSIYPYLLNVPADHLFRSDDLGVYYTILRFALEDRNTMYIFSVFFSVIHELLAWMLANWDAIVDDIEKGTIGELGHPKPGIREELMKYIKPNPKRAAELRAEYARGVDGTFLKRIWPNMSVIYGISGSVYTTYARKVRAIGEGIPFDFSIHGASEGLMAAPDHLESENRILAVDSCYFEFIPAEDESRVLSLDGLEPGEEYEIVITNQAGLYRYRIGDIIKCEGYVNDCPLISFSRRKGHFISICGEKTTEADLAELVRRLEERSRCRIENWLVYADYDTNPAHYVLAAENSEGRDLRSFSEEAEEDMRHISKLYDRFRVNTTIGPFQIVNQAPGTHGEWKAARIAKGTAPTQVKPVRLLDTQEKKEFFLSRIEK